MILQRFSPSISLPQTDYEKGLDKSLDKIFSQLSQMLNHGLNFSDNFDCLVTSITTNATPGVSTVITHGLKGIPIGCFVLEKDKAGHIYKISKTATVYNVASDVASVTATVVIL